ncbi:MAG: alanine-tRNA synthetase second additional domain-containing protein [Clostridia bacterium]|nr:alanine-tRNA synthetase second additional domain-containing protein [Clostridia bacterium]
MSSKLLPQATLNQSHLFSVYFAPRGYVRMAQMGMQMAHRHMTPFDRLIGIIGEAGSGKSLFIKGMFPGLELTNDDDGVNVRPLPILSLDEEEGFYSPHTYHLDIRFEAAFTQMHVLADAIKRAVEMGRRVVVEHFDLIYPFLDMNAELLIGIGEEIVVTRPSFFGPEPKDIADIVFPSVRYRRMAHTAEDLAERFMWKNGQDEYLHSDVHHGFILEFAEKPDIDLEELEQYVKRKIERDLPVSYVDDHHIRLGDKLHQCTGPRMHVTSTGQIENFRVIKEIKQDPISGRYLVVGLVGMEGYVNLKDLNSIHMM